jgi:translation initiation factor 5B
MPLPRRKRLRQPIICVLGHVDSGKTTLLDKIRGSAVSSREVGSMTQHIGASFFPIETLKEICGSLYKGMDEKIKVKGLLVIDTPGHSIFMNLRRRGGSVADIAILVVDVLRGFEPQTYESLSILRNRKTPFLVAANKIDRIPGWVEQPSMTFIESFKNQDTAVQRELNEQLYRLMGTFSRLGFKAERFDRVANFTQTIAIAPVSAKTGEGVPELLAILIGLTQQFMEEKLVTSEGPAKGTILEVKKEAGLGTTLDAIIYDGVLNKGDLIVLGGKESPIVTRVRAILLPKPLDEMRDPRDKFSPVESVSAAAGVKISAPNIDDAVSGAPLYAVGEDGALEEVVRSVSEEVNSLRIVNDQVGVILKTDTLGSLEAIVGELENHGVPVRFADVGDVSRREIIEAAMINRVARLQGVVLAFNVKILPDAEAEARAQDVPVFQNKVVYRLIEEYNAWAEEERKAQARRDMEALVYPGKIRVLPGLVFRKSKPAVFGVEVLSGKIQPKHVLISVEGRPVGEIAQIQDRGEAIPEAGEGVKVAISVKDGVLGHYFDEGDFLYVDVPEDHVKEFLAKYVSTLSSDDVQTLKELIQIKRKTHIMWGI